MNQGDSLLSASIRTMLVRQIAIILAAAGGFLWFQGYFSGLSAVFGGCGAVVMTGFLAWRLKRLDQRFDQGRRTAAANVMLSVAPRFVLVLLWFWVGLAILNLPPMPMVTVFALAYAGYLLTLLTALKAKA